MLASVSLTIKLWGARLIWSYIKTAHFFVYKKQSEGLIISKVLGRSILKLKHVFFCQY